MTLLDALERIAELEALLEHAVYVKPSEAERVAHRLSLNPSWASMAVGLYRAGEIGLTCLELDACLPKFSNKRWIDPEFRSLSTVKVQLYRWRRRRPGMIEKISGRQWARIVLTEEGRRIVGEALGA